MKKFNTYYYIRYSLILLIALFLGCDDFVEIDPPHTELIQQTVFADDLTADAAMADIYFGLKSNGFASGGATSISLLTSFSSDEQIYYSTSSADLYLQFNDNELLANNDLLNSLWSNIYRTIFKANSVIEGLTVSKGVSQDVKDRLLGEAKFIRAFCNFYLVNLWGDVPLTQTTDYKENNVMPRAPVAEVYNQILLDLQEAITVLPTDYSHSNEERVRANKWAATALLARVYLYGENWTKAEEASTQLIADNALFSLEPDLVEVFRTTSPEVILQLWSELYPLDQTSFAVYFFGPIYGAMRPEYVNSYDADDQRWAIWGRNVDVDGVVYPCYFKYIDFSTPPLDYTTVFRLSEQYLIRAEARLRQQKLDEARQDINVIRSRAGLPETPSSTADELFNDIVGERKSEFATEWGHRWFDLKRWGMTDAVLSPIKPGWSANDVLFPIPETQIINNPLITQNPG